MAALPPQPLGSDWRDWPLTPGSWRYETGQSAATFGTGANGYVLRIACDIRQRQVTLATAGKPGWPQLTIRTSAAIRTAPSINMPRLDAAPESTRDIQLPASDPLLDAMAFSRGHFTIEEVGKPPLVIPAHPEIGRVIEDCRG